MIRKASKAAIPLIPRDQPNIEKKPICRIFREVNRKRTTVTVTTDATKVKMVDRKIKDT